MAAISAPSQSSYDTLTAALATAQEQRMASVERCGRAAAALDAALDDLERVVGILRASGGYLAPEDQGALWRARARLAAHGRGSR
jgi:hypothetical protein